MFLMVIFSVLLVALLLTSALLSVGSRYSLLPAGVDGLALVALQFAVGTLISTLIFLGIYRLLPNKGHAVERTVPGAFASGLLLESLSALFPIYERSTNGAATYGVLIALLFLLLSFFFLLGQITVIGALVNVELNSGLARAQPGAAIEREIAAREAPLVEPHIPYPAGP